MVKTQNALQLQIETNNVILDNAIRQEKKYAENRQERCKANILMNDMRHHLKNYTE